MLRDLFGSTCTEAPKIPVVTKAYEESYMRQPMFDYERPCVMGALCECNFLSEGFTAVEFLLPSEAATMTPASERQMCVLCHRKLVQKLFYDIVYAGSPYRYSTRHFCHSMVGKLNGTMEMCATIPKLICKSVPKLNI